MRNAGSYGPLSGPHAALSARSSLEIPPATRPYFDPTLSFDFESTVEARAERERQNQPKTLDPRYKTVVCVHWVNSLCMKGEKCEFLHEMDLEKMPECRQGQRCIEKMCPFKHVKDEERALCNNYNLGFCQHGGTCRYQHKKRRQEELPAICDYAQVTANGLAAFNRAQQNQDDPQSQNLPVVNPNSQTMKAPTNQIRRLNYRTALCQSFSSTGTCSYGNNCDFAHSKEEMEYYVKQRNEQNAQAQLQQQRQMSMMGGMVGIMGAETPIIPAVATPLDRLVLGMRNWTDADNIDQSYIQPLSLPPPEEPLPDSNEDASFRYFICRSSDFQALAGSLKWSKWLIHRDLMARPNEAFATSNGGVYFFFVVDEDQCVAGVARMTSPFEVYNNHRHVSFPVDESSTQRYPLAICSIEWTRLGELTFKKSAYLTAIAPEVELDLPIALAMDGQELPPTIGHALMTMMYRDDEIITPDDLHEKDLKLQCHPLGAGDAVEQAKWESVLPMIESSPQLPFPVRQEGYLIGIPTPELFSECLTRGILGFPKSEAAQALNHLRVGTIVIIHTLYDRKVHGVFEAITGLERLWENKSFLDPGNPEGESTLFMQFRFRLAMKCDSVHENALGSTFTARYGPYRAEDMQHLVTAFATKTLRKPEPKPSLKIPSIDAYEKGLPPPVDIPKGFNPGQPEQLPNGQWKHSSLIYVDFDPKFKAPNKMIGLQAKNMKQIQKDTGCTRARVYANNEAPAEGVIEMVFEATTREILEHAHQMGRKLFEDVMEQWKEYQRRGLEMKAQAQAHYGGGSHPHHVQPQFDEHGQAIGPDGYGYGGYPPRGYQQNYMPPHGGPPMRGRGRGFHSRGPRDYYAPPGGYGSQPQYQQAPQTSQQAPGMQQQQQASAPSASSPGDEPHSIEGRGATRQRGRSQDRPRKRSRRGGGGGGKSKRDRSRDRGGGYRRRRN